jgi:ferrous iron transport protein A
MNGLSAEVEVPVQGLLLTEAPVGHALKVLQILGGCQRLRRLLEIGVYPGASIEVASAGARGPVIVRLGETRLAIGRNVARSVVVEPLLPA